METRILCRYFKSINSGKRISDNFAIYGSNDLLKLPEGIRKTNKSGYATVKVVGNNLPRLTDWTIGFVGEFRSSPKYGYTFYAKSYEMIEPSTQKGIIKFLSSSSFPGIGQKTAEAIVKEFKDKTLDIIENNPNMLLKVKGCSLEKIQVIRDGYAKNIRFSKLCTYLGTFGISQNAAIRVNDEFGSKALELVKENPYIIQRIKGVGFHSCEKIARYENVELNSNIRVEGGILETLKMYCESTGNMFMDYATYEKRGLSLLNAGYEEKPVDVDLFRKVTLLTAKKNLIVCRNGNCVYLKEYDEAESNSATHISRIISQPLNIEKVDEEIDKYNKTSSLKLCSGQIEAIRNSLKSRLSIITGGPGTGKTTILKAIIDCYKRLNPDGAITLLAPTGKAARRMSETTGLEAFTIHSKLKLFDDYNAPQPLEEGLVIVDETSMLDNLIFVKLLTAVGNYSQLIFVGDIDQLPSVGAGSVLAEMIISKRIVTSRLYDVFRQKDGGSIVDNAMLINEGYSDLVQDEWFNVVPANSEVEAIEKIKNIYKEEVNEYGADDVALLSPLRRTQNGKYSCVSDNLNTILQNEINPSEKISMTIGGIEYKLHDRVLQWKNGKESANGDIGVIKTIEDSDEGIKIEIEWDNGNITFEDRESMQDITLAYSLSIHKSQGSEYSCVIIPILSEQICPLFRRNLLYTGITRGKKKVYVVGDKNAINYCIKNSDTNKRNTLLSHRIRFACS